MPLHRLTSITVGVPDVEAVAGYYEEWGLERSGQSFSTLDGGEQLRLTTSDRRRLVELGVGVDDQDDLGRIAGQLRALDLPVELVDGGLATEEPIAGFRAVVTIEARMVQREVTRAPFNAPGRVERSSARADGILRQNQVRPRKLGHVVIGSVDQASTQRFFTDGLGFKVSDLVGTKAAFMRCSTDHHNVLVQSAPINFLHHTSWEVDDVDEVGRGAMNMLEENPERHVWGLGRHYVGSNFFWYLRDPAGNFSEYYSDMDEILDDQLWEPKVFEGARSRYAWGPPPPPSMLKPEDLAGLMAGHHTA